MKEKPTKNSLWEVLVPKNTNEGVEIAIDYHQSWDENVRQITGGLTILKPAKGQWISPEGELFVEPMIPVRVMATKKQIRTIVDLTAAHYNQEAVMYYKVSKKVRVKNFPRQGPKLI